MTNDARPTSRQSGRFVTLTSVSDYLDISSSQAYALVRSGDLRALRVGGRGQWRIHEDDLEAYIARMYQATAARVADWGLDTT